MSALFATSRRSIFYLSRNVTSKFTKLSHLHFFTIITKSEMKSDEENILNEKGDESDESALIFGKGNRRDRPATIIAPSILSCDFAHLAEECSGVIAAGADWIHVDVMDGHFVPNLTIGAPVIECLRKSIDAFLDCHLMVSHPEKWIRDFSRAGASSFIFHLEAVTEIRDSVAADDKVLRVIEMIKENKMKVGIALKPETPVESVFPYIHHGVDVVIILTVNPGFGGQEFMKDKVVKCKSLREKFPNLHITVDGGMSPETVHAAAENGANVIVAGNAIFGSNDRRRVISKMRKTVDQIATIFKNN